MDFLTPTADLSEASELLEHQGYAIIPNVINENLCDATCEDLRNQLHLAKELVQQELLEDTYVFGNVKERSNRDDIKLCLDSPLVRGFLRGTLETLEPVLSDFATEDGTLLELGALHSFPGASAQHAHADTYGSQRCVVTVFTALQDVDLCMGPTIVWPRSHLRPESTTPEMVASPFSSYSREQGVVGSTALASPEETKATDSLLSRRGESGGIPVLLKKGHSLVMDSRLVHCGSAHLGSALGESHEPPAPRAATTGATTAATAEATATAPAGTTQQGEGGGLLTSSNANCDSGGSIVPASSATTPRRVLLYSSWLMPGQAPQGSTLTLLPEYQNRFRLKRWREFTDVKCTTPLTGWSEVTKSLREGFAVN
jgi:ectoine hydroxylase-related dioxygenase (phytanoyl-CoA dioxygenase family)